MNYLIVLTQRRLYIKQFVYKSVELVGDARFLPLFPSLYDPSVIIQVLVSPEVPAKAPHVRENEHLTQEVI